MSNVQVGGHERSEVTDETIKDGWLQTSDIGKHDEDGYGFFLDRTAI